MSKSELEGVLARLGASIPELEECWRPGATSKWIGDVEKKVGELPAELRRLLVIHDGMESECAPLPRLFGSGELRPANDGLLNISNDANGAYLCLDDDGRVVEIPHDSDEPLVLAADLPSFFTRIAEAVEAGSIGGESGVDYQSVVGGHRRIVFAAGQVEAEVGTGNAQFWSIQGAKPVPKTLSLTVLEKGKAKKTWTVASQLAKPRVNPVTKKVDAPRMDLIPFPKVKSIQVASATLRLGAKLDFPVWVSLQMLDQVELWRPRR